MTDAELQTAAEAQFDSIAYGGLEYIRGGATHKNVVDAFIAGAKWQADQYTEALQLMREMAEALDISGNANGIAKTWLMLHGRENCVEYMGKHEEMALGVLKKYRASRWWEEK